jgi:hypothetical protein
MTDGAASTCRNCGAGLVGAFCHACGQAAQVHRSVLHLVEEFFHGLVHFDGKLLHTLPLLVGRPGVLTRRYVQGQRARYVSPLALFLFAVFALFFAASLGGELNFAPKQPDGTAPAPMAIDEGQINLPFASPALKAKIAHNLQNPDLLSLKLANASYKYAFLLVLLSVPFIWLLFAWRRDTTFYDHVVFALYSLSFMALLYIAGLLLAAAGAATLQALLLLVVPVHMFFQLRGAYALSTGGALWRTLALLVIAAAASVAFGLVILGLGLVD